MQDGHCRQLTLTVEENNRLVEWARRRTTAQALALRARIVLACAQGDDQYGGLAAFARDAANGRQVAPALCRAASGRIARCPASRPAAQDHRREGRRGDRHDAGAQAAGGDALEHAFDGQGRGFEPDGSIAHLAGVRLAAASC